MLLGVHLEYDSFTLGAIHVLRNPFFQGILSPPTPRNATNVEPYTFVTFFSRKADTPYLPWRYVTLEWPLHFCEILCFIINFLLLQAIYSFRNIELIIFTNE